MNEKKEWFISHSSKDIQIVDALVNIMKTCGISYWKAPEMIPIGSNYAREIPKAINDCSVFVFIISEASQDSIWVSKEVDMAIGYRKKILPLKIDTSVLNDMYHFYLNNVQIIEVNVQKNGQMTPGMRESLVTMFMQHTQKTTTFLENTRTFECTKNRIKVDTRSNALRINKIPLQCDYCGEPLQNGMMGVYKCSRCGKEHYDDFRKIRNFLEENGPSPAIVISRGTGVSTHTIDEFFKDNYSRSSMLQESLENKSKGGAWHLRYGEDNLGYRKR